MQREGIATSSKMRPPVDGLLDGTKVLVFDGDRLAVDKRLDYFELERHRHHP